MTTQFTDVPFPMNDGKTDQSKLIDLGVDTAEQPGNDLYTPVNYNTEKFLEEDPKLVEHMNNQRDKLGEIDNKEKEIPKIDGNLVDSLQKDNTEMNIVLSKLANELCGIRIQIDDFTERQHSHSNNASLLYEGKKAVGFPTHSDAKGCMHKMKELTHELAEQMETTTKALEKILVDVSMYRKKDELYKMKLLKIIESFKQN